MYCSGEYCSLNQKQLRSLGSNMLHIVALSFAEMRCVPGYNSKILLTNQEQSYY